MAQRKDSDYLVNLYLQLLEIMDSIKLNYVCIFLIILDPKN